MAYETDGTLTTDKRTVDDTTTWDTQTDWEAYQSATDVSISNGVVQLAEITIPDQQDLFARYDFSQEDGTLPITDQTGNGHDLDQGQYSGVTSDINGVQAGLFDGTDDGVFTTFSALSQPNHVFMVFRIETSSTTAYQTPQGTASGTGRELLQVDDSGYRLFAGTGQVTGGNVDTNNHISAGLYDGSNSNLRIDASSIFSADAGAEAMDGLSLGYNEAAAGEYINVSIGEVLVYPMDKSSIVSDVEQYLDSEWGPIL